VAPGTWRELIKRIAVAEAKTMEFRSYPLLTIQQNLGWWYSEVLFQYTHFHVFNEMTGESKQSLVVLDQVGFEQNNFDLEVDVSRSNDGERLSLVFAYNPQVLDEWVTRRLGDYYLNAYEKMLRDLDKAHHMQTLLKKEEAEQLLVNWNQTQAEYPREKSVHELFEAQVERRPETVAVVFDDQHLSYDELNKRANQLGRYLMNRGVCQEKVVGLCLERSLEMIVGMFGVLKAGGAYMPLDPSYPGERMDYMVEDAGLQALVTVKALKRFLPTIKEAVVEIDEEREEISKESTENCKSETLPEGLAYMIYTSGSTGKPKGVQISHGALVNFLWSMRNRPGIKSDDVLLAETSLSFDIAGLEIYLPLIVGARVKILRREIMQDGAQLLQEVKDVTTIQATPSGWMMLIESGWEGNPRMKVLCGGEALTTDLARKLIKRSESLWNMYGPTETTIWSVMGKIEEEGERIRIGKPIGNTLVYVLNRELNIVPIGVVGELYIGGDGLARGYRRDGGITAEKFVPNSFVEEIGKRLYRTGDLVRWEAEGRLEFIGRSDYQVKIRGFRIELGEIEQQLARVAGIRAAVVIVREDEPGQKQLVAYVVPSEYLLENREQDVINPEVIKGYRKVLEEHLPDYMVPTMFVLLQELPLTPNGKVDRKRLPAPDEGEIQAAMFVAPRNEIEQTLCEVWQEVFKRGHIGVQDNFFSLGGDSILSIRMITTLKSRGIMLEVKDIFQYQTIEQLAVQSSQRAHLLISKLNSDATELKERLLSKGAKIETGIL
jgi:amino acid adenylation domain-containing protein